jgi:hypothetical protein
VYIKRRNK